MNDALLTTTASSTCSPQAHLPSVEDQSVEVTAPCFLIDQAISNTGLPRDLIVFIISYVPEAFSAILLTHSSFAFLWEHVLNAQAQESISDATTRKALLKDPENLTMQWRANVDCRGEWFERQYQLSPPLGQQIVDGSLTLTDALRLSWTEQLAKLKEERGQTSMMRALDDANKIIVNRMGVCTLFDVDVDVHIEFALLVLSGHFSLQTLLDANPCISGNFPIYGWVNNVFDKIPDGTLALDQLTRCYRDVSSESAFQNLTHLLESSMLLLAGVSPEQLLRLTELEPKVCEAFIQLFEENLSAYLNHDPATLEKIIILACRDKFDTRRPILHNLLTNESICMGLRGHAIQLQDILDVFKDDDCYSLDAQTLSLIMSIRDSYYQNSKINLDIECLLSIAKEDDNAMFKRIKNKLALLDAQEIANPKSTPKHSIVPNAYPYSFLQLLRICLRNPKIRVRVCDGELPLVKLVDFIREMQTQLTESLIPTMQKKYPEKFTELGLSATDPNDPDMLFKLIDARLSPHVAMTDIVTEALRNQFP